MTGNPFTGTLGNHADPAEMLQNAAAHLGSALHAKIKIFSGIEV